MLETAIVMPMLLFVVFSIMGFADIYYKEFALNDALRTASRAASSKFENCSTEAHNQFVSRLEKYKISVNGEPISKNYDTKIEVVAKKTDSGVNGLEFTGSIPADCSLCALFSGKGGSLSNGIITSSLFIPLEIQDSKCSVTP